MLDQRRQLIAERRKAATEAKRQKEELTRVMEEVRSNANKASHFVADALSGRLSIHDLAKGDLSLLARSPARKVKSSGFRTLAYSTTSQLLGLQGKGSRSRTTRSEGFDSGKKPGMAWDDQMMLDAALGINPPNNNNQVYKPKSFITQNESEPVPYISPYELSLNDPKETE